MKKNGRKATSGNTKNRKTEKDEDHSDGGGPTDIIWWCGPSCGPIMAEGGPLEESLWPITRKVEDEDDCGNHGDFAHSDAEIWKSLAIKNIGLEDPFEVIKKNKIDKCPNYFHLHG